MNFSIIIPVYNRPQEIEELLYSLIRQEATLNFEVVIVEDGSSETCQHIVEKYKSKLSLQYFFKENSGPGASRNYGMERAKGNYFIILDSDVILPEHYMSVVSSQLEEKFTDGFGGPDAAHKDFTPLQKAINYAMTSLLTTGGIRGKKKGVGKFQPRSFNMGISKTAFQRTNGFSDMRAGEDIDFTFRMWEAGFETQLIAKAFVYHKRRNTIGSFFKQTFAFGTARPILNRKYPETRKLTYWFPSLFALGFDLSILLLFFGHWYLIAFFAVYLTAIFADATVENKSIRVGFLSVVTSLTQFFGYGLGFLESLLFSKTKGV
ncbi:glycosyltransferase [Flavobacteriaceae bacterium S356]|uniref:Glycosyltransferase n=1 Tax=Asprobacillus argus TaxID=3076534 RepID=A0ABU3LHH9_9FLAO|nr:glycosyltransferase [Flavobacteriaceae bacterium S356]